MDFLKRIKSQNYDRIINPEFIIIHYTGGSFERVKKLMEEPNKVSAHFVIDESGNIDNPIEFRPGICRRAWHAGISEWLDEKGTHWVDINSYSIGIEIVNLNGNILPYTNRQYEALIGLCKHIFTHYPDLASANKILGHEQIAAARGKADPGLYFSWSYLFECLFPGQIYPDRKNLCPQELADTYRKFLDCKMEESNNPHLYHSFWHAINASMEKSLQLIETKNL